MKITKSQLKQIIKEELEATIVEETKVKNPGKYIKGARAKAGVDPDGDGVPSGDDSHPYDGAQNEGLEEDVGQKVDRNIYKQQLRGKMDPLSKEELEKILPGELIADPMNPATFSRPGTLIPLGKKDGKAYFKTEYGPVMMKQIEVA
tara:strand:+ start:448 stop:888 length:441 start_codon:yes stop_codon:yes gene_type:complete